MYSKRKVWGLLILVAVVFALLNQVSFFNVNITNVVMGVGFLVYYFYKKKKWALWVGSYFVFLGMGDLLRIIGISFGDGIMFLILGLGLFFLYYKKDIEKLLVPASILTWIGSYDILKGLVILNQFEVSLFFLCIAASFLTIFIFSSSKKSTKWIKAAIGTGFVGGIFFIGELGMFSIYILNNMKVVLPIAFIFIGGYILFKEFKKA